jgi:uncharacterized membrane protein YkvA (DUF1232 family)
MSTEHTAAWDEAGSDQDAGGEGRVRAEFWPKVRRVASRLPFAQDLVAAYFCAFDPATPLHVKAALLGALAYFVLPIDAVPDVLPLLGYTDDAAILATAIKLVTGHIRPAHRDAAREALAGGLDAPA